MSGEIEKSNEKPSVVVKQESVDDSQSLAKQLGDAHFNMLPRKRLIICLGALALASVVSFADQTGVTVALPTIAKDLDSEQTINWAGTASLLANTVCQVLFGRISDIFGRKTVMLGCLVILAISDLCCGFSQTGLQFYIFRAFAGIGNGGVSSLSMVILSDVTTLEQRGKYQGILGSCVGIGNSVGPFIMAGFMQGYSWRGFYYFLAPFGCVVIVVIYFFVDGSKQLNEVISRKEKFKKIDYFGIFFVTISLTLLLVAISGGGSSYPWNSPKIIVMFVVGGVCFVAFLIIESKTKALPMVPLGIFKTPSLCLILGSTFFFGICYYSFIYYMPYYFEIVKGKDAIHSSIFLLPLVICQAVLSIVSGQIISRTLHYLPVVITGYTLWLLGICLLRLWTVTINDGICVLVLLIMGSGVGFVFQPSIVAAQAQSRKEQRAVVISTRNVMRSFGGALGTALGSTIVSNSFLKTIGQNEKFLPSDYVSYLKHNIYNQINVEGLNPSQKLRVKEMYLSAMRNYFYFLIPLMALSLISSFFIRDRGLKTVDETENEQKNKSDLETQGRSDLETQGRSDLETQGKSESEVQQKFNSERRGSSETMTSLTTREV